jgi:hypothetical protein
VAQLRRRREEIEARGARLWLVTFGLRGLARRWQREHAPGVPLLLDEDRALYRAYGLRSSWWRSLSPRTLLVYARHLLAGRRLERSGEDWTQLGGDFVVDRHGMLRLARPSREAADRPAWPEIAAALAAAQDLPPERQEQR